MLCHSRVKLSGFSTSPRWIAWSVFATRLGLLDTLEILRARSTNDYGSFHAAAWAIRHGLDRREHENEPAPKWTPMLAVFAIAVTARVVGVDARERNADAA